MPKKKTPKEDDDIVRPRTAYNLFFKFTRLILVKEEQTSHPISSDSGSSSQLQPMSTTSASIHRTPDHWSTRPGPGSIARDWNYDHITPSDYESLEDFLEQVLLVDEKTSGLNRKKEKPRRHCKTHGKIGFKNLAALVSQRWKSLKTHADGCHIRQVFNQLAIKDRERFVRQKEIESKRDPSAVESIEHTSKDSGSFSSSSSFSTPSQSDVSVSEVLSSQQRETRAPMYLEIPDFLSSSPRYNENIFPFAVPSANSAPAVLLTHNEDADVMSVSSSDSIYDESKLNELDTMLDATRSYWDSIRSLETQL